MKLRKELIVMIIGALLSLFLLANLWGLVMFDLWTFAAAVMMLIFMLDYLPDVLNEKMSRSSRFINLFWLIISVAPQIYLFFSIPRLEWFYGSEWTTADIFFGTLAIVSILKLTHKKYGWAMPIIALVFIAYTLLGHFLPLQYMGHDGFTFSRMVSFTYGPAAMYGTVLNTFVRIIFLYMLFGAFLQASGVGDYMMTGAFALAGKYRGGPAKVAVVSSALLGTINGNSVANVATTGAITIPLMKRVGYRPYFAGAVEAVASTGGQILPPVMGAGAFIMAEFLQLPYSTVAIAAAIPALLYYLAVFLMVDLEAIKIGLRGLSKDELQTNGVLKKVLLIFPVLLLIYQLIITKASVTTAGIQAIFCSIVVSWFYKEHRMGPKKIFKALYEGARDSIGIAAVCATAGIIIGCVTMTGLGTKFSSMVLVLAQGNLILLGILTGLICLILGMGLPTTAAYIITVTVAAPALLKAGVDPLAAHMFVFYYAILSAITPPVAGAAYAGASIAGAPIMKTGFTAVKLGIVAYIVPFFFINNQAILAQGEILSVLQSCATAVIGVVLLAIVLQNVTFFRNRISVLERIVYLLAALALIDPGHATDIFGLGFIILGYVIGLIYKKTKGIRKYEVKEPVQQQPYSKPVENE